MEIAAPHIGAADSAQVVVGSIRQRDIRGFGQVCFDTRVIFPQQAMRTMDCQIHPGNVFQPEIGKGCADL